MINIGLLFFSAKICPENLLFYLELLIKKCILLIISDEFICRKLLTNALKYCIFAQKTKEIVFSK